MFNRSYVHALLLMSLVFFTQWFMSVPERVEQFFAQGWYLHLSRFFRLTWGRLPFSVGDLAYAAVLFFFAVVFVQSILSIVRSSHRWKAIRVGLLRLVLFALWSSMVFYWVWGMNYYRLGIEKQFGLQEQEPSREELIELTTILLVEVNNFAPGRVKDMTTKRLGDVTVDAYRQLGRVFPALAYRNSSLKTSLFGVLGNYMGYGGYYNPFSGEAHLNDQMPGFTLPFIAVHEVAHQLGYARESEANFIGYLASSYAQDSSLRYSANLEMFLYANGALRSTDSVLSRQNLHQLSPIAQADLAEYRSFSKKFYGPLDAMTTWIFTRFLRFNNQPEGMRSYNRGMVYVLKYMKKTGKSRP